MLVVFDMVSRYLRYRGHRVTYVRNITDVDDKIINRARETGVDWRAHAAKFTVAMHEDLGPADRKFAAFCVAKAADREPLFTISYAGAGCELGIDDDHFDGVDREANAGRERDQVVDRHDFVNEGFGRTWRDHDRSGPLSRRYQIILAQPAQGFADGVAADRKSLAELFFGG
jgi:hypothetical protein